MKIVALKERAPHEYRVAITPETTKFFIKLGHQVCVERGAGLKSNITDQDYEQAGASLSSIPLEILSDADILLKVQFSPFADKISEHEFIKDSALIIGLLNPHFNDEIINHFVAKRVSLLALELIPRITKVQSMDVLSSQANLAGYRAVIEAVNIYQKALPKLITAAGTIVPANILILGAGVAGLQAIATAKRLGAVVTAYDVRADAKEQVESLGGKFLYSKAGDDFSDHTVYAKETTPNFMLQQEQILLNEIEKFDIVITTIQVPGRPAPKLLSKQMIHKLKAGSVIVDMATPSGGNCALSIIDQVVEVQGVKIIGYSNLPSKISQDASKLYAKNLANLVQYLFKENKQLNVEDEIIKPMLLCHRGQRLWP